MPRRGVQKLHRGFGCCCDEVQSHGYCHVAVSQDARLSPAILPCSLMPRQLTRIATSREELRQLVSRPHVRLFVFVPQPHLQTLVFRAKAKRLMEERMRDVDIVLEVRDSRAPYSCRCLAAQARALHVIVRYSGTRR